MGKKFIATREVCARTSLSRTTLWRLVAAGDFPQPIKIAGRRIAYDAEAVDDWMAEKAAA